MCPHSLLHSQLALFHLLYTAGTILLFMLTGQRLKFEPTLVESFIDNCTQRELGASLSPDAMDLLRKMFRLDPNKRLSLEQIKSHPFLRPLNMLQPTAPPPQKVPFQPNTSPLQKVPFRPYPQPDQPFDPRPFGFPLGTCIPILVELNLQNFPRPRS